MLSDTGCHRFLAVYCQAQDQPLQARIPWTTSKIHGSPEPPAPYRLERVFPKLGFNHLTHMSAAPGTTRLFVTTEHGQIYSFNPDDKIEKADPFLNFAEGRKKLPTRRRRARVSTPFIPWSFTPSSTDNRFVYVAYVVDGAKGPARSLKNRQRVARFTVSKTDPPVADPASEKIILEWPTEKGGHNGCTLLFGPDGFLYISVGDGGPATPPDLYKTGQDLSDLLASVLRIDVDNRRRASSIACRLTTPS